MSKTFINAQGFVIGGEWDGFALIEVPHSLLEELLESSDSKTADLATTELCNRRGDDSQEVR